MFLLQILVNQVSGWRWRARTRRQLALLDARELRDIGLSHCDRWEECNKPFWRG